MDLDTLKWLIRVASAVGIVAVVQHRVGTSASLLVMFGLFAAGFLPPVFPLLYRLYTTKLLGYRVRGVLHPRLPAHSSTVESVRRLTASSTTTTTSGPGILIIPVPVLADNYAYIVACERTRTCALVDAADPERMLSVVKDLGLRVTHVLTTHKHWDHAGGNDELVTIFATEGSKVEFVGSSIDKPAATTRFVEDSEIFRVGDASVRVVATPGHTTGHVMFLVHHAPSDGAAKPLTLAELKRAQALMADVQLKDAPSPAAAAARAELRAMIHVRVNGLDGSIPTAPANTALLTGDCIFCGGCGAMFECRSAADVLQTYDALHNIMQQHPTGLVYVGHEYSARLFNELLRRPEAMPAGSDVNTRYQEIVAQRRVLNATVPSTMLQEMRTNPLLTLQRDVLTSLARKKAPASTVETAIYASSVRKEKEKETATAA